MNLYRVKRNKLAILRCLNEWGLFDFRGSRLEKNKTRAVVRSEGKGNGKTYDLTHCGRELTRLDE